MPTPSPFARRLADVAFGQHTRFHMADEADPALCRQIRRYWTETGLGFTSCVSVPWSAAFVSWCMLSAGATEDEFTFAAAHSVFVHRAIRDARAGVGLFHGVDIDAHAPAVGDLVQNNRLGTTFDFAHAASHSQYKSHSAVVVEVGQDSVGRFALTIGGNEGNSIRRTVVRLRPDGRVRQRAGNPYICVVRTLK